MGNILNPNLSILNDLYWTSTLFSLIGVLRADSVISPEFLWSTVWRWAILGMVFIFCSISLIASVQVFHFSPTQPWILFLMRWPFWIYAASTLRHTAASFVFSLCCCTPSLCPVSSMDLLNLNACNESCNGIELRNFLSFLCTFVAIELVLYAASIRFRFHFQSKYDPRAFEN